MARMPSGEPRSVPDPDGEGHDEMLRREGANATTGRTSANGRGLGGALRAFQDGPDIPRPSVAQSFIPVVGPAWEAAADLQDKNYFGFGLNAAAAASELLPVGVGLKGIRAATKGIGILKKGSVTADASRKVLRNIGAAVKGQEIHHSVPLKGLSRNAQSWKNHYAFLKVLPTEQHRRLTGGWAGQPRYNAARRLWYGTTDWMKAAPAGALGYLADGVENVVHPGVPNTPKPIPRR